MDGSFDQIFLQIVFIIVKSLRNTNLVAPRRFKMKKDLISSGRASLKFLLFQLGIGHSLVLRNRDFRIQRRLIAGSLDRWICGLLDRYIDGSLDR